ncbi:MAG: PAS domain-containing protein [Anaerolineae bacterium]|nr:PAS domain-containing protein [Anaerolineae bacterium]
MVDATLLAALLDSLDAPLLFADTGHVIRYMNQAAVAHYEEGAALLGRSLLDCHDEGSCRAIEEVLVTLREGEVERLITQEETRRIYMRAVRDADGRLLGYYERYEPVTR